MQTHARDGRPAASAMSVMRGARYCCARATPVLAALTLFVLAWQIRTTREFGDPEGREFLRGHAPIGRNALVPPMERGSAGAIVPPSCAPFCGATDRSALERALRSHCRLPVTCAALLGSSSAQLAEGMRANSGCASWLEQATSSSRCALERNGNCAAAVVDASLGSHCWTA